MEDSGGTKQAAIITNRLMIGARSEVELPWGGITTEKSIHVLDFVRSLSDVDPEAEDTYTFLCESCHPSYLRLVTWSFTSPELHNWTNDKFRIAAHNLFNRTLEAVEKALQGIGIDTQKTLVLALPYLERDMRNVG
jgi:hypothetical protein